MDLNKFIHEVSSMGLPVDRPLDVLKQIYMAERLPYEYISGGVPRVLVKVEPWIIELLVKYGLMVQGLSKTTVYGRYGTVRYHELTSEGYKVASEIYSRELSSKKDRLAELLSRYPARLIRVLGLSTLNVSSNELYWLEVLEKGWDFHKALSNAMSEIMFSLIDPNKLRDIYERSKELYGNLGLVFRWMEGIRPEAYTPTIYEILVSKALVMYNGRVHNKALEFMEELVDLGVATRIPYFTSSGEYISDVFKAPPEMAYLLIAYSANVDLSGVLKRFFAAHLLTDALYRKVTKREVLEAVMKLGINEEMLALTLDILYNKGITSRYNKVGGPDAPAFLVFNKERAKDYINQILDTVDSLILSREP